jgi:hypothetical protein
MRTRHPHTRPYAGTGKGGRVIDVHVEQGDLGGADVLFKPCTDRIRLVYDAGQLAENQALELLRLHLPHLDGVHLVHRSSAI